MCLMKDTKGNLFLDSKTIKEYRQRGVVSRKIILCYILAFLRWTSIGLPPGQKCSRWVRRHNGISLSPARLLKKYTGDAASIPLKKKNVRWVCDVSPVASWEGSQPIHIRGVRRPGDSDKLSSRKSTSCHQKGCETIDKSIQATRCRRYPFKKASLDCWWVSVASWEKKSQSIHVQ